MSEMKEACGCLVGTVEIVGCVMSSPSPWFAGKHGFMLRNAAPLARPIPLRGMLGFFDVPDGIEEWLSVNRARAAEAEEPLFEGLDMAAKTDNGAGN
jgi:hypothetical protein